MTITCGIDWAEGHHDVAVLDDAGRVLGRRRIDTGVTGFSELMSLLAEHAEEPTSVPVAIETDKNLIVVALQAAGLAVFAINPRAVARYRERYGQSGKKSDPGDAALLADVLRTDRHQHRQLPMITPAGLAVKALARQHQEAIWALHQTTSRLRSVLLEFYPQALKAFPNLKHKAALTVLAAASTPELGSKMTRRKLVALVHRCARRNDPLLVEQIVTDLRAEALRQPEPVEAALGQTVITLVGKLLHRPALLGAARSAAVNRVLSEGEQTALGLSGFFTEAAFDGTKSALILDDPVTSLDHARRSLVAQRLVELAADRQVIVFTHEVTFVGDLIRHAAEAGLPVTERWIQRNRDVIGVCADKHPRKAKDVGGRIGTLEADLGRMKRDRPEGRVPTLV